MSTINKKTLFLLNGITIKYQNLIINKLKLYDFAKSAIDSYCKEKKNNLEGYDFKEFKHKFKISNFKKDKEIKNIEYKEVINIGTDFIESELSDAIFVFNMSTFENWFLDVLKNRFLDNPEYILQGNDKIDLLMLRGVNDLQELWEKIIDNYLHKKNINLNIKEMLKYFLKIFEIEKTRLAKDIIEKINEHSLCRNIIIHNKKMINRFYIKNTKEFARFKKNDTIKITENVLFEQGDNLLKFMQDFRKYIG